MIDECGNKYCRKYGILTGHQDHIDYYQQKQIFHLKNVKKYMAYTSMYNVVINKECWVNQRSYVKIF